MGNSLKAKSAGAPATVPFAGPNGLYATCAWDDNPTRVRDMILRKELAPRWPGTEAEDAATGAVAECPICFCFYPPHINATTCCRKLVCSECFLQVQSLARSAPCPFCTAERFSVRVVGASALPATPIPVNVSAGAGGAKAAAAGAAPLPAAGIRVRALSEQSPASASVPAIARATVADRKALHTSVLADRAAAEVAWPAVAVSAPGNASSLRLGELNPRSSRGSRRGFGWRDAELEEMMLHEALRQSLADLPQAAAAAAAAYAPAPHEAATAAPVAAWGGAPARAAASPSGRGAAPPAPAPAVAPRGASRSPARAVAAPSSGGFGGGSPAAQRAATAPQGAPTAAAEVAVGAARAAAELFSAAAGAGADLNEEEVELQRAIQMSLQLPS